MKLLLLKYSVCLPLLCMACNADTITNLPATFTTYENTVITPFVYATESGPLNFGFAGFRFNTLPTHGTVVTNGSGVCDQLGNCNQYFRYTPETDYTGSDSFTFSFTDPLGVTGAPATASIQIVHVDSPAAVPESGTLLLLGGGLAGMWMPWTKRLSLAPRRTQLKRIRV
jgi:hypothetical protein